VRIGIIAEDEKNLEVSQVIIRRKFPRYKMGADPINIQDTRKCKLSKPDHIKSHLDAMAPRHLDKVLIGFNSDSPHWQKKEEAVQKAVCQSGYRGLVKVCASVKEVEAWLLSDGQGMTNSLGIQCQGERNPEALNDAKGNFKDFANRADRTPDRTLYKEVAENLDIDLVSRRCPSLLRFLEKAEDC